MIRQMTEMDLEPVCDIYQDANPFTDKPAILAWTLRNLKDFPKYHLVFETGQKIAGAISGILCSDSYSASIEDVAIQSSLRSNGLGSKLVSELISKFETDGVKSVRLWVHWKDARAIPFYYKKGFRITHSETTNGMKDVPDGEEIIHMARDL